MAGVIDDGGLRVQRRLGEEDDVLGAPGFDCLHTAMKTTTARVLDKVAAAEEEGGHGFPRRRATGRSGLRGIRTGETRKRVPEGEMERMSSEGSPRR